MKTGIRIRQPGACSASKNPCLRFTTSSNSRFSTCGKTLAVRGTTSGPRNPKATAVLRKCSRRRLSISPITARSQSKKVRDKSSSLGNLPSPNLCNRTDRLRVTFDTMTHRILQSVVKELKAKDARHFISLKQIVSACLRTIKAYLTLSRTGNLTIQGLNAALANSASQVTLTTNGMRHVPVTDQQLTPEIGALVTVRLTVSGQGGGLVRAGEAGG